MGFWKRVVASIVDNFILSIAFLPLFFILLATIENPNNAQLTYQAITFVLTITVILLFWQFKQATPGKMIFNGKIVDAVTFQKPSMGKYVIRYIGYIPSSLALGLGFIWVAIDKQKRGWHDMMAGTLVVTPGELTNRRGPRKPAKRKDDIEDDDKWSDAK